MLVFNCLTVTVAAVVDKKLVMSKEEAGDMGAAWLKTNHAGSGPLKVRERRANQGITEAIQQTLRRAGIET